MPGCCGAGRVFGKDLHWEDPGLRSLRGKDFVFLTSCLPFLTVGSGVR